MKSNPHAVTCAYAVLLISAASASFADTPAHNATPVPPVRITAEIIHEATIAPAAPARDGSSPVLTRELPPPHDMFRDSPRNLENIPNGCSHNNASLCFDYRTGSAMYKPMRGYLPGIPGMTPHNLSIHRNKIVAQYTFK